MVKGIHVLLFAIILFASENLVWFMGVDYRYPVFLYIIIAFLLIIRQWTNVKENKYQLILLGLCLLYGFYRFYTDKGTGTRMAVMQLIATPVLLCAYPTAKRNIHDLNYRNTKRWGIMLKLFLLFYIVETLMAIVERLIGTNILGWGGTDVIFNLSEVGSVEFRSTALLGHPLYNALVVSTGMAFILFAPLKTIYKFALWFMGYTAILCFNTRSSMVGNALLFAVYWLYVFFGDKKASVSTKRELFILSFALIGVASYLVFNTGLGGRLMDMGLFDDSSSQVRIDVWSIFDYIPDYNLFFGFKFDEIDKVMYSAGLYATENFWIDMILRYGLVFMIPYVYLIYKVTEQIIYDYTRIHKLFVSGAFLLIASTNNSLFTNFLALFIFLMLCEMFNPIYIKSLLPEKIILKN